MKTGYIDIDELIQIIRRVAMEAMMTPIQQGKNLRGDPMSLTEVASYNSHIAMNNEGIRDMADSLINELTKDEEET